MWAFSQPKKIRLINNFLQVTFILVIAIFGQKKIDQNIIDKLVRHIDPSKNDEIIEIGPGPGGLTRSILKLKSGVLYTIDKDLPSAKM